MLEREGGDKREHDSHSYILVAKQGKKVTFGNSCGRSMVINFVGNSDDFLFRERGLEFD